MLNEQSGKFEINITHDLSNIANLRKRNRVNLCGEDMMINAIVEIRSGIVAGGLKHERY
jgi:hypothetical protein